MHFVFPCNQSKENDHATLVRMILSFRVICLLGRSRGFGFVTFSNRDDADYAITKTNNIEWMGRSIHVNVSRARGEGGGFRGGGGGRGGPRG
jgi:RNA recognition motif-containing protein